MLFQIILFTVLHTVSILFMMAALYRLYAYIRRYRFSENKYTLLMSFIHLHWLVYAYIILTLAWPLVSYLILF